MSTPRELPMPMPRDRELPMPTPRDREPPMPTPRDREPPMPHEDPLRWTWLGRTPYAAAADLQERARADLLRGEGPERLLLIEHPPTVTVGRNGDMTGLLASVEALAAEGVAVERSTRGGHLTWHAPGQLVAWPILDLRRRRLGPRQHVERLAGAVAAWLGALGLSAAWSDAEPGVWTVTEPARKVASIGVHVHRDATGHGVAINLSVDLQGFGRIRPCGLSAAIMTSVEKELGRAPDLAAAAPTLAAAIAAAYGMRPVEEPGLTTGA